MFLIFSDNIKGFIGKGCEEILFGTSIVDVKEGPNIREVRIAFSDGNLNPIRH